MNGEPPDVMEHLTPRANKPHQCCECGGTIHPGEKYHLYKGIWDGKAGRFKVCSDCRDLSLSIGDDETPFEHLFESACDADRLPEFRAIQRKRK